MGSREDLRRVHDLLAAALGIPLAPKNMDPIEGLILAILSQNTSDANRDRAFQALKKRFSDWKELAKATPGEVAEAIRVAGLWETKSRRILECLRLIEERHGSLSLEFLRFMSMDEAQRFLCSLPGVGLKTARCVMLFQLEMPAFPVDTHVLRVAKRLGWISQKASPDEAHRILQEAVPSELVLYLHLNMIRLGRTYCRPRRPRCSECVLLTVCPTGKGTPGEGLP